MDLVRQFGAALLMAVGMFWQVGWSLVLGFAISAVLHPAGVAVLLTLQWYAFTRKLLGRPAAWKDRAYQAN